MAGYRNSFTNPKSSPVAKTVLSLVRHEAVTSVTSPIIGQIPSQQEPRTLVHDVQEIFSAYNRNSLFEAGYLHIVIQLTSGPLETVVEEQSRTVGGKEEGGSGPSEG